MQYVCAMCVCVCVCLCVCCINPIQVYRYVIVRRCVFAVWLICCSDWCFLNCLSIVYVCAMCVCVCVSLRRGDVVVVVMVTDWSSKKRLCD